MIVTVARVNDYDQFMSAFSTVGLDKRQEHGCRAASVFRDPDDRNRLWVLFDWDQDDYEQFLADPTVPDVARQLALAEPPLTLEPVARYEA